MKQPIQLLRVVGMGFKPLLARALHLIRRVAVDQSRLIRILERLMFAWRWMTVFGLTFSTSSSYV